MATNDEGIDRASQLEELVVALGRLITNLDLDPDCQWKGHFVQCLSRAQFLLDAGFDQEALNGLSASVRSVFGGMGSFNDYVPARFNSLTGQYAAIEGMEGFNRAAGSVYDAALKLVVVSRY